MTKNKYSKEDVSLDTLLDLDGEVFPMDNGYWTKYEVSRVIPTQHIPHGVRYSLTLHDRNRYHIQDKFRGQLSHANRNCNDRKIWIVQHESYC